MLGILAAGDGRRMRAGNPQSPDKLMCTVAGRSVLAWTLAIASSAAAQLPITVAVGPDHAERAETARTFGAEIVVATDAHRGLGWTLQHLLRRAAQHEAALILLLGDDPLAACALELILAQITDQPTRPAAIARPGAAPHPVYLPPALIAELASRPLHTDRDVGLGDALQTADTVWITPPTGIPTPIDVDHPDHLDLLETAIQEHGDISTM